jgi:hypothetical protein
MQLLATLCAITCLTSTAHAENEVAGLPVPQIIRDDAKAGALFPMLIGLRTAELCLAKGKGISNEQMETLTIAVATYAETLGISPAAEKAVRGFASTIVDREAKETMSAEWEQTKCARMAEIFAPPATRDSVPSAHGF